MIQNDAIPLATLEASLKVNYHRQTDRQKKSFIGAQAKKEKKNH